MISEYRMILTATFSSAEERDSAYDSMKAQVQNYSTAHPEVIKRADMTRDDYFVADDKQTEKVI